MTALGVATPPTKPTRPANEHVSPPEISEKVPVSSAWKLTIVAVAIVSNAALLIAQQAAFRLLAPVIGSSVETWSAIIGVFLLGIAIGNHYAGKLADRFSAVTLISGSLAAGAISMLLMPVRLRSGNCHSPSRSSREHFSSVSSPGLCSVWSRRHRFAASSVILAKSAQWPGEFLRGAHSGVLLEIIWPVLYCSLCSAFA
jgi:hypothetical protein